MKVGAFFIGKEQVRFPETLEHPRINSQGIGFKILRKLQPGVVPTLPQEDVDSVILFGFEVENRKTSQFLTVLDTLGC